MGDKEDYLTSYRVFFENFAATVNPEDQLPVNIAGYTITESELTGEVLYWITQYLSEKQCPLTLMTPLRRIILDEVQVASKKTPNDFGYKSDESVYIALRLMQAVTARVNDVCLRYLDNARLDTLPPPPPLAQRDLKTVSCATKNSRRVMEDRHVEIGNLEALFGIETTEPTSFYAVYDGHAGSAAATYCAAHLHQYLVESPHFSSDLRRAMRDAYLRTDTEFIRKSNQERACGGSTAVTVCVRGRRLLAGWAGDSLALLAKRMRLMQLVRPHKPGRPDERDRIQSSGGTVMYWGTWRVNGQLAVSRAIGDAQYKPYVTARPEIATVELDGDEDFVVVACDGLWDFVSEDDVALAVYRQLAADPDDLKAVTKRLIVQAKRQGSADNISIIVVFLKDPRDIAADNCPPMDLGLDNAMMNVPPFTIETEACKRQVDAAAAAEGGECAEAEADTEVADNGVDNSDSDSEDLGPETAVDIEDIEAEARQQEPQAPTPPADAVEESHVDGALVDNVAESGEDSEDEWNYFKGEGEREENNPSDEPDEPPRSETPCQDNSAWETSSVDMNSSPLNPDAPVFVPGSVAGADVLLAESPRKPLPMDDIELPDVAQFETEAVVRPADILDLDNCDQLNGHHNVSLDEAIKEHLNGNDKCNMDSLGFGFNVGIEPEKVKDTGLIQDFQRIQKDTTDFCNIQVFQTNTETNPFAVDASDELFERLKNKERDPMSMSFYQEKDDDTCERLSKNESHVDLNAVQPLPDSDDEDMQANGICENDKENINPEQHIDPLEIERDIQEPNNDIIRFDDRPGDLPQNIDNFDQEDNFVDYNVTSSNNIESYSNIEFGSSNITQDTVLQTDTPESHKLLFEQIPEIPDGKSSELGFTNDEIQDPSESEKEARPFTPQDEISQDIEMDSKLEDSPCVETVPQLSMDPSKNVGEEIESQQLLESDQVVSPLPIEVSQVNSDELLAVSPAPHDELKLEETVTAEPAVDEHVDAHENIESHLVTDIDDTTSAFEINENIETEVSEQEHTLETPLIKLNTDHLITESSNVFEDDLLAESPLPSKSPLPSETILPSESPFPSESPLPSESPMPIEQQLPVEELLSRDSPLPVELTLPSESPLPDESLLQVEPATDNTSPLPKESPLPSEPLTALSPAPAKCEVPADAVWLNETVESPVPSQATLSPLPREVEHLRESPLPCETSLPADASLLRQSPAPRESPLPTEIQMPTASPMPAESPIPTELQMLTQSPVPIEPTAECESPAAVVTESIQEEEVDLLAPVTTETHSDSPASPLPVDVPLPRESPLPVEEVAPAAPSEPQASAAHVQSVASPPRSPSPAQCARLAPDVSAERAPSPPARAPSPPAPTAPAPDLVPDEHLPQQRLELVTDVDIGIPESRAQEICVPVTSEIQLEEVVHPPAAATPPPTPAVEATAPALDAAPLSDTPIAGDATPQSAAAAAAVAVAAAGVVAGAAAVTMKPRSANAVKRSPTTPTAKPDAKTPKPTAKSAPTARTPTAATAKRPATASTTPAARTPTATKAPTSASKASAATRTTPATRTPVAVSKPSTPASKSAAPAAPRAAPPAKPSIPARAPPTTRSPPTKSNGVAAKPAREAPAPARAAPPRAPPAPRAAPKPAAPAARPAAVPKAAARPAPRPAPAAARPQPKPAERKPLPNGDAKDAAPARPAARPPPITRPAPKATPRAAPAPPAPPAPNTKVSAPKPLPRAAAPLDKQSKDLANKRITAKAAPPRTALTKTSGVAVKKAAPKKPAHGALSNGDALSKPPPSPPAADNALLPDVIA